MTATPVRHIRVPDDEWDGWVAAAAEESMSVARWVRLRCGGEGLAFAAGTADPRTGEDDEPTPMAPHGVLVDGAAIDGRPCRHPKSARDPKGYATFCSTELGGCGARL